MRSEDIVWRECFDEALAEAAEGRRMLVVKPVGQGMVGPDDW
jgi:hypothetical protein